MRHYTSLSDSNYLPRLLVLHCSLQRHSSEPFRLHVLAMDEACGETLRALNLPQMLVVDLATFECARQEMAVCRGNRTWLEYLWTCASNFTAFTMQHADLSEVTYIDADVIVLADPLIAFNEIGDRSIAITLHRLIPSKKHLEINGLFNVGFVHFKNARDGKHCLETWAAKCRTKCSAEDGCGDQKALDGWPSTYGSECCIIEHIGVNAAPWNIGNWTVTEGPRVNGVPIVTYHVHEFAELATGNYRLTNYDLRQEDIELIYWPYIQEYKRAKAQIEALQPA